MMYGQYLTTHDVLSTDSNSPLMMYGQYLTSHDVWTALIRHSVMC